MSKSPIFLIIILFLFCNQLICAPNVKLDSLIQELKAASVDSVTVDLLLKISDELSEKNPVEGEAYANQALELSLNINYKTGIAKANYYLAYYDMDNKRHDQAISKFIQALKIYHEKKRIEDEIYVYYGLASLYEYEGLYDSALHIYKNTLRLSDSIQDEKLTAHSNYYLGGIYHLMARNEEALKYTLKAHQYYESNVLIDDDWYALNDLGIIHDEMGMYVEALDYNLKALEISDLLSDKQRRIIIANNIAILYNTLLNNDAAINYYESAYETSKIIGDRDMEATLLGNIAGLKAEEGDTATSFLYTRMALKIQLENDFLCALPYSYEGLGDLFVGKNMLDSAMFYLKRAEALGIQCNDLAIKISVNRNLGIAYKKQKQYKLSETHFTKSLKLAQEGLFKNEEREAALELYKFHKLLGNDKKALAFHELYQVIGDSIFDLANSERINKLTTEYAFKKEKKLLELESDKQRLANEAAIHKQTLIRNAALLILFFTIIFLILVFQSYLFIKLQNNNLKKLNDEKNAVMGIVAHDLRNPLNNIKTIIPILKEDKKETPESRGQFIDMIGVTADRMYEMIDKILDVNAVEAMKVKLKMKTIDLAKVVKDVFKTFQIPADRKDIKMIYDAEYHNYWVKLDQSYLIQILENLISNALKFSPAGTNIYLSLQLEDDRVQMIVRDEGPGIGVQEQEKLFKRYEKLSNAPTGGEVSTGLGLSIVKKYVNAMDGQISCESEPGQGTSFIVSFKQAAS